MDCPICSSVSREAGLKKGRRSGREFQLRRCTKCGFGFVEDPWTDYANIYDEAYYEGKGSDPMVDYAFEYLQPGKTVRRYEWRGIAEVVSKLTAGIPGKLRWLDYGCGNGGLVRHVRETATAEISGYDTGMWADRARQDGLPILTENELKAQSGSYDIITAIEVIEHVCDPVGFLKELRKLLKPGGQLFLTTQNICNAPARFTDWAYVHPEIHVSYFSAQALDLALQQSGFQAEYPGFLPGWDQIIRFKILKNLGCREMTLWERIVPWKIASRIVDMKFHLTDLPIGIAV